MCTVQVDLYECYLFFSNQGYLAQLDFPDQEESLAVQVHKDQEVKVDLAENLDQWDQQVHVVKQDYRDLKVPLEALDPLDQEGRLVCLGLLDREGSLGYQDLKDQEESVVKWDSRDHQDFLAHRVQEVNQVHAEKQAWLGSQDHKAQEENLGLLVQPDNLDHKEDQVLKDHLESQVQLNQVHQDHPVSEVMLDHQDLKVSFYDLPYVKRFPSRV